MRLLRPERAVHADGIGAGERERRERVRRGLAEGRAAVGEERHLGDDRDLRREPAHGADRLGRFEQAPEGLEQHEVDARLEQHARLLLEDLAHLRQVQRAVRLDESAERADRARDENVLAGRGFPGEAHALAVDLLERVGPLVRRQLDAVGVPGVRRQDAGAGLEVVVVDFADGIRIRQIERRAGLVGRGAPRGQQRPDRPVGEQDLFGDRLAEVLLHFGAQQKSLSTRGAGPCGPVRGALIFFSWRRIRNWHLSIRAATRGPVAVGSQGRSLTHSRWSQRAAVRLGPPAPEVNVGSGA